MKIENLVLQVAISASVAASGVVHAYLYTNGYRESRRSARHSCCRPAFSVPWRC